MGQFLIGSIEISKVPKELFKSVKKSDGSTGIYLNIAVSERKEVGKFGETHGVQFTRDKDKRIENENTFFGSLKVWESTPVAVTAEQIAEAHAAEADSLPF